ncbi:MAG: alpha-amylase family glycosyl hydrolase [Actinomycetota bacterium]
MASDIDDLIASHRRPPRSPRWDERDAWLITYADMFGPDGLTAVGSVMDGLGDAFNGVHVLPFHPSSSDGGFSVMDYDRVDPTVGDWADVARLAAGRRLMADAVVNHVSAQGRWFREWATGDRDGFFREIEPGSDLATIVRPRPGLPVARVERAGRAVDVWATFSVDQVDLDYRTPAVLLEVTRALLAFVARGASAIRLDAVAFLWKEPGRPSIHEPETHAIVAVLRSVLHEVDPGIVLITETNVPHEDNISYFGSDAAPEAHAVYQFTLPPLTLHAVQTGDTRPLVRWLRSLEERPSDQTFMNFLASHDGVGVRPARGWLDGEQIEALGERCRAVGGVVNEAAVTGEDGSLRTEPYELAATWFELCRAGTTTQGAAARHMASHAIMLALAGIPLVYSHSLTMGRNDRGRASASGVSRDLNRARYADAATFLTLARQTAGGRVLDMLSTRAASAAFHPGSPQRVLDAPDGVIAIARGSGADQALVVVNCTDVSRRVELPDRLVDVAPYGVDWAIPGVDAG